MEQVLRSQLMLLASAYCAARGVEMSTVAQRAMGDWRFFDRIQDGASFTARKFDQGVEWFSKNWPADAAWPENVARPVEGSKLAEASS